MEVSVTADTGILDPQTWRRERPRRVGWWLAGCTVLVLGMIVLGALTRLHHSGLSMVDWKPVSRWLPPMNDAEWTAAFQAYQQFPEFQKVNSTMTLEGYKGIFWLEYLHRLWGRVMGLIFALPAMFWAWRGVLPRFVRGRFLGFMVLGGLQAVAGWLMVQSGLVDRPSVSPYRLAIHLSLAALLFAWMFWTVLDLLAPKRQVVPSTEARGARHLVTIIGVTLVAGAFVAGNRAGHIMNDFPTMGANWIPDGLWAAHLGWRNVFENPVTVQFQHRLLAYGVFLAACVTAFRAWRLRLPRSVVRAAALTVLAVLVQAGLGIATLLTHVSPHVAATHQLMGMLVLASALVLCHRMGTSPAD